MSDRQPTSMFEPSILGPALLASLRKLDPRAMVRNPVMFVVEVGALFTTALWVLQALGVDTGAGTEAT